MSWRASRNALRFSSSEAGALASAGADVLRKGGAIEVDERASVCDQIYGRHTES
jgi:hypothetical protein